MVHRCANIPQEQFHIGIVRWSLDFMSLTEPSKNLLPRNQAIILFVRSYVRSFLIAERGANATETQMTVPHRRHGLEKAPR